MVKVSFYIARHGNWWDKLIAFKSAPWRMKLTGAFLDLPSHCELVLEEWDDGKATCFSSSPRDGGCRYKVIDISSGHWQVVPVRGVNRKRVLQQCRLDDGRGYDWVGAILNAGFRLPFQSRSRLWCSEQNGRALGLQYYRVTPYELMLTLQKRRDHVI